jgi:hypothetical protein
MSGINPSERCLSLACCEEVRGLLRVGGKLSIMADSVNDNPQAPELQSLADILVNLPAVRAAKRANALGRIHHRLIAPIEPGEGNDDPRLAFQHTVLCQTSWPYRDPGDDVREWKRINGSVALQVQAGDAWNPAAGDFVRLRGCKPKPQKIPPRIERARIFPTKGLFGKVSGGNPRRSRALVPPGAAHQASFSGKSISGASAAGRRDVGGIFWGLGLHPH